MVKHIEVIGIDHGWSNMKTATQIFTTGVKEITTEPAFYDDVVELEGKYYKVGGKRLEVRDTKGRMTTSICLRLRRWQRSLSSVE